MSFNSKYKKFYFVDWKRKGQSLEFKYRFDDELEFIEKLIWPDDAVFPDNKSFARAADAYHLLAGISYYKAFLSPTIELLEQQITEEQANFLNKTYRQGVGEFLYTNKLDPKLVAQFQSSTGASESSEHTGNKPLVLVGGGKDSLVTIDLFKKAGVDFELFRSNSQPWIDDQADRSGAKLHKIKRLIDPKLIDLNEKGALNGHVPITAIISAAAVLQSIISKNSAVVLSNEASANIPNTSYMGMDINHQYSKSLVFERDFADYITNNIASGLEYFSMLRPWTELRITEYFVKNVMNDYRELWSSSNHNFRRGMDNDVPEWDENSPKTISVYGMVSAFADRESVIDTFGFIGYSEETQKIWEELLGIEGIKPFECVADTDEMRLALQLTQQSGQWPELTDFTVPEPLSDDYERLRDHRIPKEYQALLPTSV